MSREAVLQYWNQNSLGCDLIFSFFTSAVNSIRSDSNVRPFPPMYYTEDGIEKDFNSLRSLCNSMPSLKDLPFLPNMERHLEILNWLYSKCDPKSFRVCNRSDLPLNISGYRPKYILSVRYTDQSEQAWNARRGDFDTSLAFHGSHLDRFYSILRVGLQQIFSMNTNPLYGEGVYLSKQLPVSIIYAPYGSGWSNSTIGESMSVVAVCEYIDDASKRRSVKDSRGSVIRDIIVVKDSDSLRIRYLLVFAKKLSTFDTNILSTKFLTALLMLFFAILVYYNKFVR